MPLGIIQSNREHAPGTILLFDTEFHNETRVFKRGSGKNAHVILSPQPSNNPNDPLNWPKWKKDMVYIVVFINTIILASVPSPMLAPATFALAEILQVSLDKVAELSGYQLLVVGCFGPIVSALARKFGKRPQFVFAAVMGIIGTIVCICSGESYNLLLTGRLIQGFGTTAFESLSIAVIGDIYFVHERPVRTGLMILTLTCLVSVVAVADGPITEHLGWRYLFIIHLPFVVVGALAVFFLLPETQFKRPLGDMRSLGDTMDQLAATAESKKDVHVHHSENDEDCEKNEKDKSNDTELARAITTGSSAEQKKSYIQGLALYSGVYSETGFLKLLIAPIAAMLNPAVAWTILVGGFCVAFYVSAAYMLAQVWSSPPYNLGPAANGYFYVGALIGGLTGGIGGGWICSQLSKRLTKINHGTLEPEFVIPAQSIAAVLFGIGWFVFMWDVDHPTPHGYYLGAFCHGCLCCAITITSTSASLYILNSYREQSLDIFIIQMTAKNLLFYGFSTFINTWTATKGPGDVFKTWGITSLCIVATCIPMYIFGKVLRAFIHRKSYLKNLGA